MNAAVIGSGSWGTALALLLAEAGHQVRLLGRDPKAAAIIDKARENRRYLPGRMFPQGVVVTADLPVAVAGADLLVFAVPAAAIRGLATATAVHADPGVLVACASKGLEEGTLLTLDRVLNACLPTARVVMLSGPTFAVEIAAGLPAAAVAASVDGAAALEVQQIFGSERFRVYTNDDVVGVAIGGALKNVIAIAVGCADGLGFGANARAALITRGLNEMGRLAIKMGGNPLTLSGLAGLGDLVLTCTGELSRNRRVGLALAQGEPVSSIVARLGQVAEGVATANAALDLAKSLHVEIPITAQVAAVLSGRRTAREAVGDLLSRELKPEQGRSDR